MDTAGLNPREVAELSGTARHVVEKAIEERVLPVGKRGGRAGRMLPTQAVAYAALVAKLDLKLSAVHKKKLFAQLTGLGPDDIRTARIEIVPAVEVCVGRLVGDALERAEVYRAARDSFIAADEEILGGAPVIRGTRVGVHSLLGRIEHGETVDDILDDNPDLKREAVEAAITYAKTHPLMGRPSGRPWKRAA